jgi:hypothetical protein
MRPFTIKKPETHPVFLKTALILLANLWGPVSKKGNPNIADCLTTGRLQNK